MTTLRAFYARMAAQGINAGKVKVGLNRETTCAASASCVMRWPSAANSPALMIDSNEYWSPKQAIRHIGRSRSNLI